MATEDSSRSEPTFGVRMTTNIEITSHVRDNDHGNEREISIFCTFLEN